MVCAGLKMLLKLTNKADSTATYPKCIFSLPNYLTELITGRLLELLRNLLYYTISTLLNSSEEII